MDMCAACPQSWIRSSYVLAFQEAGELQAEVLLALWTPRAPDAAGDV